MTITVCIPTLNRKDFLKRLLNYYSDQGFPYQIFVGISDSLEILNELEEFKNSLSIANQISFFHAPGMGVLETLRILIGAVSTKYCILQSDDDFLMHETLKEMMKILEDKNDYIGINGKALILDTTTDSLTNYPMRELTNNKANLRLQEFSQNYFAIHMALFRSSELIEIFIFPDIKNKAIREEIYVSFFAAVMGKIYHLDNLFLIRTVGHSRAILGRIDLSDSASMNTFKKAICSKINELDKVKTALSENYLLILSISILKPSLLNVQKSQLEMQQENT